MDDRDAHSLRLFRIMLAAKHPWNYDGARASAAKDLFQRVEDVFSDERAVEVSEIGEGWRSELRVDSGVRVRLSELAREVLVFPTPDGVSTLVPGFPHPRQPPRPIDLVLDPSGPRFLSVDEYAALRAWDGSPKRTAVDVVLERIASPLEGEE